MARERPDFASAGRSGFNTAYRRTVETPLPGADDSITLFRPISPQLKRPFQTRLPFGSGRASLSWPEPVAADDGSPQRHRATESRTAGTGEIIMLSLWLCGSVALW